MVFLDRYINGQCKEVWAELVAMGTIEDAEVLSDAQAVASETMKRSRQNVETIINRLMEMKYEFLYPTEIHIPPSTNVEEKLQAFEKLAGPLPLSLVYFYLYVGCVNLRGTHSSWFPDDYPDPLVIEPIDYFLDYGYQEWKEQNEKLEPKKRTKFRLALSPDMFHKGKASDSGKTYAMELPNDSVDGLFLEEWHKTTFVDYLRDVFKWGGFPGFKRSAHPPMDFVTKLAEGLQTI